MNIDCDQKILPRDRSQSHNPQRPRLSAVSMRPRTASLMRSPSRARVDCQWKAKPRISTTKPVVADSVTDSAASDCQSESPLSWMMMIWPGSDWTMCWIASALLPFGKMMSVTPACGPGAVSGSAALRTSRMRLVSPSPASIGTRARMRWSAPMTMTCRPAATPQDGIRPGSSSCRRSNGAAWFCRTEAMRSRRSASTSASAARSRLIEARFCRF